MGWFDTCSLMHVDLVIHELLIFAPFPLCHIIDSITLRKKFIRYRTHIYADMPRLSENVPNKLSDC